ncbi:hypothetical protein D3C81_1872390 [compost metagenome]
MITRARGRGEENFQTFADGHRLPRRSSTPAKLKNQELPGRAIETASFGAIRQACHALSPWHVRRLPAVRVRCCTICTSRQVSSDGVTPPWLLPDKTRHQTRRRRLTTLSFSSSSR